MKKRLQLDISLIIVGVALGISLSALFIIFQFIIFQENNLFGQSNWVEHSRCYYFNDETECGKTRYCATHVTEERCSELGGEWLLETSENEMLERLYFYKQEVVGECK